MERGQDSLAKTRRRGQGHRAAGWIAAVLVWGCSSDTADGTVGVEVFNWWDAPGEYEAMEALIEVHEERHPNIDVLNAHHANSDESRTLLEMRILEGEPPDTFQANAGHDLLRWVGAYSRGSIDILWSLDDLAHEEGWLDAFPPEVLDTVREDDVLYAVPLNVHRINALYYNVHVFDRLGLTVPTTLDELEVVCATLLEADIVPIELGAAPEMGAEPNGDALASFVFENLLVAEAGPQFYHDYFTGQSDPDDPWIDVVLERASRLLDCVDPDVLGIDWTEAANRLSDGRGAMMINGDWTKGYLNALGAEVAADFGEVPTPGTTETFVFTSDSFPVSAGSRHPRETKALLATFGSVEGQRVFNREKGSIPARTDVPANAFDEARQATINDFRIGTRALALSGLAPRAFLDPVQDALIVFYETRDPDIVRFRLRNYYDVLER